MEEKVYVFKDFGQKAEIIIKDGMLTIKRHGAASKIDYGLANERTLMINQITAVNIKNPGVMAGYIEFVHTGENSKKRRGPDPFRVDVAVYFKKTNEFHIKQMQELKD